MINHNKRNNDESIPRFVGKTTKYELDLMRQ